MGSGIVFGLIMLKSCVNKQLSFLFRKKYIIQVTVRFQFLIINFLITNIMKKVVLSLFAMAAMGLSANAQQVVKFGSKAGVNFATLSGVEDAEMKTGFHVGAFAEIFFTDKFSLQPELLIVLHARSKRL